MSYMAKSELFENRLLSGLIGRLGAFPVRQGAGEVPPHLRGTGYPGAKRLGHGKGYLYPHDHPGGWVAQQLATYTGMLNLESIGGRIIDAHLRFADQWPDLYGAGWLPAVVGLYEHGVWRYADRDRRIGYSVALFGPHGREYQHPSASLVEQVRRLPDVSSVQITFHADRPPAAHPMPPGGFRLAIVNCLDLEAGRAARRRLAESFRV